MSHTHTEYDIYIPTNAILTLTLVSLDRNLDVESLPINKKKHFIPEP